MSTAGLERRLQYRWRDLSVVSISPIHVRVRSSGKEKGKVLRGSWRLG